jgi:hypothetical protein
MTHRRVILDCETTSLEPDYKTGRGVIWELGCIELDDEGGPAAVEAVHLWRMKPDASAADPGALAVGRFYERTGDMRDCCRTAEDLMDPTPRKGGGPHWSDPKLLAPVVAARLSGATVIGAVPSFDAGFLAAFLRAHGEAPSWHYRMRDIGSMAYGWLKGCKRGAEWVPAFDASTDAFACALGVNPERFERHSALGDCHLVAAMLGVIEGTP